LKNEAKNGKADLKDRIVSTNDVLCAHMWKLSAVVREEDSLDELYNFGEVINFRKILGMGKNYPWNACTTGSTQKLTRKTLLESDLSEIVVLIRNLADSYTPEVGCFSNIRFIYR
jgi:hypothetical protein